ncbi:MAG: hypothetical protein Q8N76_00320 [Candidatus Omnitrophota bacterium]|nr:hypothetical protein [Candidatus Omnitrophota bacterium]
MQKSFNFFYAFLLAILGFGATLMAEDITLTTYYPAPYGAYDELSTAGATNLATTSGNVGIGTTNGGAKFDVAGTIRAKDMFAAGGQNIIVGDDTFLSDLDIANTMGIYGLQNGTIGNIKLGSTGPTIYGASGRVGIGVSPSYTLDVAGDINTTGDVRKSGVLYTNPDYVFEPGYKLMNIAEVKNYVLENKHLPNMPSSEEIKTDGVKIFEQNRLLLEKLEEAYLHIFQLEERIAKLERR